MERRTTMKYTGSSRWIKVNNNGDIEEERVVDEFERPHGRQEHFMITYLAEIINLIDSLGNQKMKVVKYILQKMSKSDNVLIITTKELSEKSGVSYTTVIQTLKILDDANVIQRRTGAIMINPRLMNNKRPAGEATMMIKYNEFEEKKVVNYEEHTNPVGIVQRSL